jgi:hypothetical protein
VSRMTEAGNALFTAVREGRLRVYPGARDLREHVLAASARETDRGIRLVKTAGRRKIDGAIALAMAVAGDVGSAPTGSDYSVYEYGGSGKPPPAPVGHVVTTESIKDIFNRSYAKQTGRKRQ